MRLRVQHLILSLLYGTALAQTPTSLNGRLLVHKQAADDGASITAAFRSQAGNAAAVVELDPTAIYTASTPIIVPPAGKDGVQRPQLDCHGATIVFTSPSPEAMVVVNGANALSSANGTGSIRHCTFLRKDANGPVLRLYGRGGLQVQDVDLQGGTVGLDIALTGSHGSGVGYFEQGKFENVHVNGCAHDAIYVHNLDGNHGFLYNTFRDVKFDLDGSCTVGLHIGDGVSAFGEDISIRVNTGLGTRGGYLIQNDGTILSSFLQMSGENTDAGPGLIRIGGKGYSDFRCVDNLRIPIAFEPGHSCSAPRQKLTTRTGSLGDLIGSISLDEGTFYARKSLTVSGGFSWLRLQAHSGGFENQGQTAIVNCDTDTKNYQNVWDVPADKCRTSFYAPSTGFVGIGPGFAVVGQDGRTPLGTAQPKAPLHVRSAGGPSLVIEDTATGKEPLVLNADDSATLSSLKGDGNAYVCVNPEGKIFRSNNPCR